MIEFTWPQSTVLKCLVTIIKCLVAKILTKYSILLFPSAVSFRVSEELCFQ